MRTYPYLPILLFLLALLNEAAAQQVPFLNQYAWNPRLFNPAAQGIGGEGQVTAAYRTQFHQLDAAVRPVTYLVHADLSPLLHERIGVAVQAMGDQTHLLRRFQFSGFFGYHLVQTTRMRFSLGAIAGVYNQNLDLTGRRVGDVLDLATFRDEVNGTRFDGGPGLSFEYRLRNGSALALDAAATQVFSSEIPIPDAGNPAAAYTLVPHLLTNLRYRHQGAGFAVEPTVAFRALAGDQALRAGIFDLNLNAYFLKNDLLMAGIGLRTDQSGLRFQLGVAPVPAARLVASAEWHAALGTTFEVGASYAWTKKVREPAPPKPQAPLAVVTPPPAENLVESEYREVQALAQALETAQAAVRERQAAAERFAATAGRTPQQQNAAADSCAAQLARAEAELRQVRHTTDALQVKRLQAEQTVRTATSRGAVVSDETRTTLSAIGEQSAEAQTQLETLQSTQKRLAERCANVRPRRDEAACIRIGDGDCVQELFDAALRQTPGLPDNLFPLRTFAFPGAAAVTYHFPDDREAYSLSPELSALTRHIAAQTKQIEQQGIRLENIVLVTELQEDKTTLAYQPGLIYDGSLGSMPVSYALVDNVTAATTTQNPAFAVGTPLSLEAIAVLKVEALRANLVRSGIPAGRISQQVRYNHSDNLYREETKVVVKFRS